MCLSSPASDKGGKSKVKKVGSKVSKEKALLQQTKERALLQQLNEKGQGEKCVLWIFVSVFSCSSLLPFPIMHLISPLCNLLHFCISAIIFQHTPFFTCLLSACHGHVHHTCIPYYVHTCSFTYQKAKICHWVSCFIYVSPQIVLVFSVVLLLL